jgi:uncharacterized protein (TIGR00369 family)
MLRNPDFAAHVRAIFSKAAFVADLGIALERIEEGHCETSLVVKPRHLQQDGVVHAGVLATIADHTAGGAAATLLAADQGVLSIEFKINLLRSARGERLVCKSAVLKAGRTISVIESEVFSLETSEASPLLCAKATVTLAIVAWNSAATVTAGQRIG